MIGCFGKNTDRVAYMKIVHLFRLPTVFACLLLGATACTWLCPVKSGDANLVFHCTFDSPKAIEKPEAGHCSGVMGQGRIVKGKFGNAYYLKRRDPGAQFNFPDGVIGEKGCIEFWAKLDDEDLGLAPANGSPMFFYLNCHDDYEVGFNLSWTANNGVGGAGLYVNVACAAFYASDKWGRVSYSKYLGKNTAGWHHYAVVWNTQGIAALENTFGEKTLMATMVDGKPVAYLPLKGHENWTPTRHFKKNIDVDIGCRIGACHLNERSFTMDELKIWKTDKTSFDL